MERYVVEPREGSGGIPCTPIVIVAAREKVPAARSLGHLAICECTLNVRCRRTGSDQTAETRLAAHSCTAGGSARCSGSVVMTRLWHLVGAPSATQVRTVCRGWNCWTVRACAKIQRSTTLVFKWGRCVLFVSECAKCVCTIAERKMAATDGGWRGSEKVAIVICGHDFVHDVSISKLLRGGLLAIENIPQSAQRHEGALRRQFSRNILSVDLICGQSDSLRVFLADLFKLDVVLVSLQDRALSAIA